MFINITLTNISVVENLILLTYSNNCATLTHLCARVVGAANFILLQQEIIFTIRIQTGNGLYQRHIQSIQCIYVSAFNKLMVITTACAWVPVCAFCFKIFNTLVLASTRTYIRVLYIYLMQHCCVLLIFIFNFMRHKTTPPATARLGHMQWSSTLHAPDVKIQN